MVIPVSLEVRNVLLIDNCRPVVRVDFALIIGDVDEGIIGGG